jgi:iron complex outermembrane receptor protein
LLGTVTAVGGKSSENVFTWSVAPRFELGKNASIYARVAKGYRPGGPNFIPAVAPAGFPADYKADTVISYEAGIRAETADHSFSIDASAFYIDWDDIQITSVFVGPTGNTATNANGQRARSQGVELTATARPTKGFAVVGNLAYTHARLRDDTVPPGGGLNLTGGLAGDPLPYSPTWKGSVSADYSWSVSNDVTAFAGATASLVSDQPGPFNAVYRATYGSQMRLDGYAMLDLRAGVNFDRFSLSVFARNLTDSAAVTAASSAIQTIPAAIGGTGRPFVQANRLQPRTIGATFGVAF